MTAKSKIKGADPRQGKPPAKAPAAPAKAPADAAQPGTAPTAAALPADVTTIRNSAFARRPTHADQRAAALAEHVSVTVPRAFKFTCDDHTTVDYPIGEYDMPRAHAEDSFAQGMGVTVNK